MRRPALRDLIFVPGQLLGVLVAMLPFSKASDGVPIVALLAFEETWPILLILFLAFLAVPVLIMASTVRQTLFGPLTRSEARVAYAIALAALAATSLLMVELAARGGEAVICPSVLIVAVGAAVVLGVTRSGQIPPPVHAHVALLVAYLPSVGFFCVFMLQDLGQARAGFYLAIVVCVGYAVEAVVRVRRALRSGGGAGAEDGEAQRP